MTDTEVANETGETTPITAVTSPKDLIKVPKPDKNKLLDECKVIEEKRDLIEAKIVALRREIETFSAQEQAMEAIKQRKIRVRGEFDELKRQKDAIENLIKQAQNDRNSNRAQMRFNNVNDIEKEIRKLEQIQSTTSMKLADEKKLLKDIAQLNESKKVVQLLATTEQSITDKRKSKKELDTAMDAKKKELDKIYEESRLQYDKMNVVSAKRKEVSNLLNEKKKYKTEIDALWTVFKEQDKEFKNYQNALRAVKREQQKKEEEARKAEEEARKAEIEAEEAKKIPYEEEMALCQVLSNYLEKNYLNTGDAQTAKEQAPEGEATLDGLTSFKRDDSDFMVFGGGKKKGKNGKKKDKASKKDTIILTMDMLNDFNMLQIEAPTTISTVPTVIEALKAKKVWYSEQPRPEKKEVKSGESENKTEEKKKSKKEKKSYNADEVDFPTLAGFVPQSTVANGIAEGVSDVDAIKGLSA